MMFGVVAGCGGGGAELQSSIHTTTEGQQLLDRKKPLDAGAISKEEYEGLRKRIIQGNDLTSAHFASGDHLAFSLRNREGSAPGVSRADLSRAGAESWWGTAVTVDQTRILER